MKHPPINHLSESQILQRAHTLRSEALLHGFTVLARAVGKALRTFSHRVTGHAAT